MEDRNESGDPSTHGAQVAYPEADAIWQHTLGDLRLQMAPATFEKLLLGSRAQGWDVEANTWTVEVRNKHSPAWLRQRLSNVIERALLWRLGIVVPEITEWPAPQVEYMVAPASCSSSTGPLATRTPADPAPRNRPIPSRDAGTRSQTVLRQRLSPAPRRRPSHGRPGATLGPNDYYVRLKTAFREETLGLLKGPKLSVFLCLALHQDKDGISAPGLERIVRETRCCRTTVIRALQDMCTPELPFLEALPPSAWGTNRYRVLGYASFGARLAPALFEEG